jgi:hypothetical protein
MLIVVFATASPGRLTTFATTIWWSSSAGTHWSNNRRTGGQLKSERNGHVHQNLHNPKIKEFGFF